MGPRFYALHRFIAAAALIQLFVWTGSGLAFALMSADRVRGASVPRAHEAPLPEPLSVLAPAEASRRALESGSGLTSVVKLELRATPSGLYYVARGQGGAVRLDAKTGALAPVTAAEAEETARRDQPGRPPIVATTRIERDAHVEYRQRPLPAFRVELGDADATAVYVDAKTGDVTARRTGSFRAFDFLFSLHIMDYKARERPDNPLLIGAASLASLTVITGAALWVVRIARRRRGRGAPAAG